MQAPYLAEQYATFERQSQTRRFGMWVFLSSELLLFSGLFALYAAYRSEFSRQFVQALHFNTLAYGTANTYVLLTSSFTVALAVRAVRRGSQRSAVGLVVLTILLGLAFLAIKAAEYLLHIEDGALPGPYYRFREAATLGGNRFYTMYWITTGPHAAHVAGGIGALACVGVRAARGRYTPREHSGFEMAALYWHFVDVMWLFIWPIYYLV